MAKNYTIQEIQAALDKHCDPITAQAVMTEFLQTVPEKTQFIQNATIPYDQINYDGDPKRTETIHFNSPILKRLNQYRIDHHLFKLGYLAQQAGIEKYTLQQLYDGKRHFTTKLIWTLANNLNEPVSYWLQLSPSQYELNYDHIDPMIGTKRLIEFKYDHHLTMDQLKNILNISRTTLDHYLKLDPQQHSILSLNNLRNIAKTIELSVDDLCYHRFGEV